MRPLLVFTIATLLSMPFFAPDDDSAPARNKRDVDVATRNERLVVHEWGTFTSFSGSNGVRLEYRPLVDNDLPPFVLNWAFPQGLPFLSKARVKSIQRMETPVVYFYTDQERDVAVRVGFPQGLLTEFYPPVQTVKPKYDPKVPAPLKNSLLDWGKVRLIPTAHFEPHVADRQLARRIQPRITQSLLPYVAADNHYRYARETDSALVHVHRPFDKNVPWAPAGDIFEKFLFYRGVGNFQLPLSLSAKGKSQFELTNTGPDTIRSLFLVTNNGRDIRFSQYDSIAPGKKLTLTQSTKPSTLERLSQAVVDAAVNEKLYEKEARAMINTWKSSWFGEQGTRLFYMVPRRITDELLPLQIDPLPTELIRVLVGRMEIMTPEYEARITELVRSSASERATAGILGTNQLLQSQSRSGLPKALRDMGRLAEPALVRVSNVAQDQVVRDEAALLLAQIQTAQQEVPPEN